MSPAAAGVGVELPTPDEIEDWDTSYLTEHAGTWRTAAGESNDVFDQHRQNIASPGGTDWQGDAKDAALDRVTADGRVAESHGGVLEDCATIAENGHTDIEAAKRDAVEALQSARDDGFTVADDLSVTDGRAYDIETVEDRNRAAREHAEDIRWTAERLVQADVLVGQRLTKKATELDEIRFEGEGAEDGHGAGVQFVSNEFKNSPIDIPEDKDKLSPDDAPPSPAPGQIGPFPVPKAVEDEAKKSDDKTDKKAPDPSGLGGLLGADEPARDKPENGKSPLPPALGQLPPRPDQATIDRQVAKVDAARKALTDAEAKLTAGAVENYTLGAGNGPTHDDARALAQSVFDARRELTDQTRALRDLNGAVVANGGSPIPIPQLPENADIQAFPKEPSEFERSSKALSDGSFGFIPDVAKDLHTLDNWDQASGADRMQAVLDAAGLVPLPGAKLLGEGAHGLEALGGIARHVDEIPGPHAHVEAPGAGHAPVDAPGASHGPADHHGPSDAPAAHHADNAAGDVTPYGVGDTSALLTATEATGGHLIDRHVGQTFEDLSGRLNGTGLPVVSTFSTVDEAASAVSSALQHNQQALDAWIANGAIGKLQLDAPFTGGEVLSKGSSQAVEGTGVRVVLKSDGAGGWYVLTGFPTP